MAVRQHGHRIGADLVRRVAVGRDPVRADDDRSTGPAPSAARRYVGHQPERDAVSQQLPGGQPRPLQERPRLVHQDLPDLPASPRRADHPQRRAVARRGQRAGVAVGQHPRPVRQERGAVSADPRG